MFVFKQKTAYEMRISDWSSDVCSSDLPSHGIEEPAACAVPARNSSSAASSSPCSAGRARLRNRARLDGCEGGFTETRKAGTVVCVMAVLQVSQGMGKRSEEHTSELQSLMRISYAVFCLKKKQ